MRACLVDLWTLECVMHGRAERKAGACHRDDDDNSVSPPRSLARPAAYASPRSNARGWPSTSGPHTVSGTDNTTQAEGKGGVKTKELSSLGRSLNGQRNGSHRCLRFVLCGLPIVLVACRGCGVCGVVCVCVRQEQKQASASSTCSRKTKTKKQVSFMLRAVCLGVVPCAPYRALRAGTSRRSVP